MEDAEVLSVILMVFFWFLPKASITYLNVCESSAVKQINSQSLNGESLMQMVDEEVSVSECTGDEQTYRMSEVEES